MDFRDLTSSADDIVFDTFAEEALINGDSVSVIVNDDAYDAAGLSVPVESRTVVLMVRTADADRIGLAKGATVEFRSQQHQIRDFAPDNYGMTRIEVF